MMTTTAVAAKIYTDLTCWKCGEESLQPMSGTPKSAASSKDKTAAPFGNEHSICSKCGAKSVNAAQAKRNRLVDRKARRANLRAANGRSV